MRETRGVVVGIREGYAARYMNGHPQGLRTLRVSVVERGGEGGSEERAGRLQGINQLRGDNESLSDSSHQQDSAYRLLLDQLSIPSMRTQVFAIADALIGGGKPIPTSGGGGGSGSDLRWDGRNPDEEEDAYRRRCLLQASKMVSSNGIKRKR